MFNTQKEIMSIGTLSVEVVIDERVNTHSGDVDSRLSCKFYNKNYQNIGEHTVVIRGQYVKPVCRNTSGNGAELWKRHGNELLKQFQLID